MIEFSRKSLTNRIDAPCLRMQAGGLQSQALGEFHSKALECPCAYRLAVCLWGLPTYYLSASKSVLAGRQRGCPSRQEAERRREKGRGGSCVRGRVTHRVCAHSEQHRMCCATYHRGHSRKLPAGEEGGGCQALIAKPVWCGWRTPQTARAVQRKQL
jgi:hypothetical protein